MLHFTAVTCTVGFYQIKKGIKKLWSREAGEDSKTKIKTSDKDLAEMSSSQCIL